MAACTAIPLGPGWHGILCVPGPAFLPSGFGGQEASGLGRVMPITRAVGIEWAYHALVILPSMNADPLGGWWPSRSLVVRWYLDCFEPTSLCQEQCYYKANDEGAFDLAMPINENPNDAPTWHCYEKAYVTHPDWDDVMYDHYEQFMESVIPEVISKELAKVPADEKENRRAELQALKREWFDLERRNYVECIGVELKRMWVLHAWVLHARPVEFAVRSYNVGVDCDLNDWEYHGHEAMTTAHSDEEDDDEDDAITDIE